MTMKNNIKLDNYDRKILNILQENGRISNADLAREIGLTPPSTLERVKKLQNSGIIKGYQAILDKKKLGRDITCFVTFNLKYHGNEDNYFHIKEELLRLEGVEEVHLVTGRHDYILKVNLKNVDDLKNLIVGKLASIGFIDRMETSVTIASSVSPHPIPIHEEDDDTVSINS